MKLEELLPISWAAYRHNNSKYVKQNGDPIYDGDGNYVGETIANRSLIRNTIFPDANNPLPLIITNEDKEKASVTIDILKSLIFKIMCGKAPKFDETLASIANKELLTNKDVGIIAFLPSYTETQLAIKELTSGTDLPQEVGSKVELEINVLYVSYFEVFGKYSIKAMTSDGKHGIEFLYKDNLTRGSYSIRGKIKSKSEKNAKLLMNVTRLNYVKVKS